MADGFEAVLESIGERLRAARERAGLTLDQLASLSGVSKPHLSRLESADRQPSISALLAIANAVGVPVSSLLGENLDQPPVAITSPDDNRYQANGTSIASCSGFAGSNALEALRITVEADRPPTPPAQHEGEEWLYVLDGTLDLELSGGLHRLERGMTAHFDAARPHRLMACGGPVELLLVAVRDTRMIHRTH